MSEKLFKQDEILNAVFAGEMTAKKGIEELRLTGADEREARRLAYEAHKNGKRRRQEVKHD